VIWTATKAELMGARDRLSRGKASNGDHAIVRAETEGRLFVLDRTASYVFWLGAEGE